MQTTSWQDLLYPGAATDFFSRRTFPPFDPTANGYSAGNALWLAELSRLVYRHDKEENNPPPQPTRTSFLVNVGLRQRAFFLSHDMDTQAMLVEPATSPSFAVLVFRGTEQTIGDHLVDLEIGIPPINQNISNVHDGFEKALNSVWSEIAGKLSVLTYPVFYTGHSLGAALATLAAARRAPKALYTFGSPRVGNAAFTASLGNVSIYRIVDDEDIVTTIPPEATGFRHVGIEHRLNAPKNGFSHRHLTAPPKPLADHAPVNYVERI